MAEQPPRKRCRIVPVTDDESDDSPVVASNSRGCRPLETDESDDDSPGNWTSDESDGEPEKPDKSPQNKIVSPDNPGWQSDSSDGDYDKCPVCLLKFSGQEIGTPDTCDHVFCSDCLIEWSNHVNTCPVDRKEFVSVIVREKIGGEIVKKIPVKPRRISLDELVEEQPTICQICQSGESEETMLLCDMCDHGFHMECLSPPLEEIPLDDWYCPTCSNSQMNRAGQDRHSHVLTPGATSRHFSQPTSSSSQRTSLRSTEHNLGNNTQDMPSTSSQSRTTVNSTSSRGQRSRSNFNLRVSFVKKSSSKRKKRKRKSKKMVIVEYDISNGKKFPTKTTYVIKKRKKKVKRRVPRTVARRSLIRASVKGHIASLMKSSGMSGSRRDVLSSLAVPQLSIFGNRNELDVTVSDDEDVGNDFGTGRTAVASAPRVFSSAILDARRQSRRKAFSIPSPTHESGAPDLLSTIMECQTLMHSRSASMDLKEDGSIIIKKNENDVVSKKDEKVDVHKPDANIQTKETPSYGGGGRGGGGNWRGNRDYQGGGNNRGGQSYNSGSYQSSGNSNYWDGNNYNNSGSSGDYGPQGNSFFNSNSPWNNNSPRNQRDQFSNFQDRSPAQRNNTNNVRGRGGNQQRFSSNTPQRSRGYSPWQQQGISDTSRPYSEQSSNADNAPERNFPNQSNVGSNQNASYSIPDDREPVNNFPESKPLGGVYHVSDERLLSADNNTPQPPIIRFKKPSLSDDEKSDSGKAPDEDKYDPTEPTIDDSSDDEGTVKPQTIQHKLTIISPPRNSTQPKEVEYESSNSQIEETVNVSPKILDQDEPQDFKEQDDVLSGCLSSGENEKDAASDGEDCPNFSIYSSTSMHIAKNKKAIIDNEINNQIDDDMIDDLVQQDDSDDEDCEQPPIESNMADVSKDQDEENVDETASNADNHEENNQDNSLKNNDEVLASEAVSTRAKFLPKRNIIKINLSSNFGVKKRIMGIEADKDPAKSPDIKAASVLEATENNAANITPDFNAETNSSQQISLEIDNFGEFASDPEDERSYTPCLDENKSVRSKDTSLEDNDKGNSGFEGLDTEMISEDEGNELFSDPNNPKFEKSTEVVRDTELPPGECEEGEIIEKNKQKIKAKVKQLLEAPDLTAISDDDKKKKRREKRPDKDDKDKGKSRNKKELDNFAFKKLSKSGKERNYRERDDKNRRNKDKRRSKSADNKENKDKKDRMRDRRREKRKDMERYDVRNVISDKSRRLKDAFGRDKSRPKSNSPDSRIVSPSRFRRSLSRHRSPSPPRAQSVTRINRSLSKDDHSKSPKQLPTRRLSSARRVRASSVSLRSASRERRSPSNRIKKSISPRRRSPSPKARKSISPRRRSISPRPRSPVQRNRRSISPKPRRSKSPRHRRSLSRNRNKRNRRSLSRNRRVSPRLYRPKSPRRRIARRSRSHSRNRSRSPKLKKIHKVRRNRSNSNPKSKSPIRQRLKRKRSRSINSAVALSRSMSRERLRHQQWQEEAKSPLYQDWSSDSRSLSPTNVSPSWTPPPMEKSPQPQNLRVILTNKEKNKKKDKKKKSNKRNKIAERITKHQPKDLGPSKEVFTSGNNILVSVSFNKSNETDNALSLPPPDVVSKRKKRKNDSALKQKKDKNREKIKKRRIDKEKRSKEIENKKPVAIIDLDKSPFKELTPSPKAVIVLSDSDNGEKEEELIERQEIIRGELSQIGFPQPEVESLPDSPNRENNYVTSTGPKTPPEPPIKFTIVSKSNPQLRAVNPLHEEEDEEEEEEEVTENVEAQQPEETGNRLCEVVHKGPNTPPEPPNSPPSSPDAYDPFEPTKSGSATPEEPQSMAQSAQAEVDKQPEVVGIEETAHVTCMSLEAAQKSNLSADDVIQAKPISPTEKVMALLKSTRPNASPVGTVQQLFSDQTFDSLKTATETEPIPVASTPSIATQSPNSSTMTSKISQTQCTFSTVVKPTSPKPVCSTVAATAVTSTPVYLNPTVPRIGIYSMGTSPQRTNPVPAQKIAQPSPTKASPLKTQPAKLFLIKPSPIKSTPIKPILSKTIISKLPLPTVKPRVQKPNKNANKTGQNGSDVINIDMDLDSSPYSPGSSDFCDLFEPPSDNGKHAAGAPATYPQKSGNKFDTFDNLFTMKPSQKGSNKSTKVSVKQMKKSKGKTIVGVKMDEDSLKILDDLPSSAVEMQVKSKFLKKLNRQERVVEEVKLVLKPHYTKKHINKEEYKDILRRAVPKICHNRSGEINPAKIQALIEAYVKKFRKKAHLAK